ncbi:MAG: chorismate synthase [Bacteroidales bacterium]|nr:chorismate synthase [Bacteroidales bacterium]
MAANTFGEIFRLTSFGESHGKGIGGIIDGCPPGLFIDLNFIQAELNRRRPGQSHLASPRQESDQIEFLSGILDGKSTGTPIAFIIWNSDQRSDDYNHIQAAYRPSHADYTYETKYGVRDHKGGGRSSARETIARVVAGAIAKLFLTKHAIEIIGYVSEIGGISMVPLKQVPSYEEVEQSLVRCPDNAVSEKMQSLIEAVKLEGDTLGGVISCHINGLPVGLGAPVFDKFHADLAKAMLSINAVKGFDYGSGFEGVKLKGSEQNDKFVMEDGKIRTLTNHSGGIQGGITNGEEVFLRVAFKPVATVMKDQETIDKSGNAMVMKGKGRHDVCVLPRAVVIVEAMAAMVAMDHFLRHKMYQL